MRPTGYGVVYAGLKPWLSATVVAVVVTGTWWAAGAMAQETPRNERAVDGSLINQDYFTANQYPEVTALLSSVEGHHMNKRVWADFYAGRLDGAIGDVKYTLRRFPNHPQALQLLGSVARMMKDPALPIRSYEWALNLYPQYALTHAQYGAYLASNGQIEGGITRLNRAIEMDPNLAIAHAYLAKALWKKGNKDLARKSADRARALGYKGKIVLDDSDE